MTAPIEQRLAADLRTLATLAETQPELGRELAHVAHRLTAVIPPGTGVTVADFDQPLAAMGATEVPPDITDERWTTRTWELPAAAVRFTATALRVAP